MKPLNIINKIINSEVQGETLFIHLYGYLGDGQDRISFQDVFNEVNSKVSSVKNIIVKLNSGGGCLYTGLAIKDYLETFKEKLTVHVEGMAASAATFIAMAGKEMLMSPTSRFMIHNPYIPELSGDADSFQNVANSLYRDQDLMSRVYSEKTGIDIEQIKSMMKEETTMFASEAIEYGFADGLTLTNKVLPMNCIGFTDDAKHNELYTIKLQEEFIKMKHLTKLNQAILKSIANELEIDEETVQNVADKIEAVENIEEEVKKEDEPVAEEVTEEVKEEEEEVKAESVDKAQLMELITALTNEDGSINAEEFIAALSAPTPEACYKSLFLARKKTQAKMKVSAKKEMEVLNTVSTVQVDSLKSGWAHKPLSIG